MSKSTQCYCIMFLLIASSISPAQEWVARYDGIGNEDDYARAIAVDDGGNVYVTGASDGGSATLWDYATVKYNSSGIEQWVVRYDGAYYDGAEAITLDGMGNVYVAGNIGADYGTIKYDSMGVEQWVRTYDGPDASGDFVYAMAIDNSSNIYVTGESDGIGTSNDYATVKYNSMGVEQWVARYNGLGNGPDVATAVAVDDAGNVYVTGYSVGLDGEYDCATLKYDSSGVEQWVAIYSRPVKNDDRGEDVAVDNAGNVYVTGSDGAYVTIKYDALGVEQWVVRYLGPGGYGGARAMAVDNAGNIYVTGSSYGLTTGQDYATVKYDSSGVEQWVARYDGPNSLEDYAYSISIHILSNVCVTGKSQDDYATVNYDSAGHQLWVARYNGPGNGEDWADAIAVDGGYIYVTGGSMGSGTSYDYATIKYLPTGIEEDELAVKKVDEITTTILRGPLQLPEGKKCKVYDITGRVVEPNKIQPGIYFIEVDGVVRQKVVKVR